MILNITKSAKSQREAEKAAVEAVKRDEATLAPPIDTEKPQAASAVNAADRIRTVTVEITATGSNLQKLTAFLKENHISYRKIDG